MSNSQLLSNYFKQIKDHPVSLVPYNPKALEMLSTWCSGPNITPSGMFSAIGLGGPQSSQGWATVQPGPFQFPQDHGPHWDIRNEWYYLACNLTYTVNSKDYPLYILLAIIRRGTSPYDKTYPPEKTQIVACEATLELPGTSTPYITHQAAFDGFNADIIMQPELGTDVNNGQGFQWSVFDGKQLFGLASSSPEVLPLIAAINFTHPTLGPINCHLDIYSKAEPSYFLQGQQGCAPCLDGVGYRYYSWPALEVQGVITVGTTSLQAQFCSGQAWLDHQWGSRMQPLGYVDNLYLRALSILGNSYPKELAPQWDWFFMHLDNGMHITTAVLPSQGFFNPSGPVPLTNTTFINVDGENKLTSQTFSGGTVTYGNWVQVNCNLYASAWVLEWPNVKLSLTVTQSGTDAGFSTGVDGQTFMEKGILVKGTVNGTAVQGTGFAEAVGYDSVQSQVIKLLSNIIDPSQVQQWVSTFMPALASGGDVALASLIVIVPPVVLLIVLITVTAVLLKKRAKKRKALR